MKRRKQSHDADDDVAQDESTPKKTRPSKKPNADLQNGDGDEDDTSLGNRRSSKTSLAPVEDFEETADTGATSEVESSAADSDTERLEKAVNTTPRQIPDRPRGTENGTPRNGLMGKKLFSTPKTNGASNPNETPRIERNANRSARRKSTRTLIERTILGLTSDNDEEEGELADQIYGSEEDEAGEEGQEADDLAEDTIAPETPSKKRGRPKGSKTRSLSPIAHDLPPHEKYFAQNKPGRAKTSNNTLANFKLLDHEEYFDISRKMKDSHAQNIKDLAFLHEKSFNQWQFELSETFNICLYGWGSKRSLLMKFAEHIYQSQVDHTKSKIVVVNGYVPSLTIRDVFNTVASAVAEPGFKLGSQPPEMLDRLIALIQEDKAQNITLIIHSIDRLPLRRPVTQMLLSRLSAHPQVHLITSADHPSFPLLWDSSIRSTYNFLFHECATFQPYTAEVDVVDEVHELLGRSGRRVGGKDGVIFVLKSLPINATNLFKILIGEQLAGMDDTPANAYDNDDDDENDDDQRFGKAKRVEEGVEYRTLYQKAVEEFICSNDMGFRSLLKE